MARPSVKGDDLLEAYEYVCGGGDSEYAAYICLETGTIHYPDEEEDESLDEYEESEKYVAIPHRDDLEFGARLPERFTGEFLPESLDAVRGIFSHGGAYYHFKNLLSEHGLLESWFDYERNYRMEVLREWCREVGVNIRE
jgi:hypothetical protein